MGQGNGRKPLVAVVMPHRNGQGNIDAGGGLYTAFKDVDFVPMNCGHSLLTLAFNRLWTMALNLKPRPTHLAMLHNDVCPPRYWGDGLLAELTATGADVLSVVVPIKGETGTTSTAVEDAADEWAVRRLTMHEVFQLPETFAAEDLAWHGPGYGRLLINTGCWICKLGDWVDEIGPVTGHRLWFRQQDRIVERHGELVADTMPEDWDVSRQFQDLGLKVLATRKVPLYHERQEFTNDRPWGTWRTDLGYLQYKQQGRAATQLMEPSCL